MARPWAKNVKDAKQLTVYSELSGGKWVNLFTGALRSFNDLKLPVRMTKAKDKESANVIMKVSTGMASHDYGGASRSRAFNATGLHGYTMLFHTANGPIEKAAVFLPGSPRSGPVFIKGKAIYHNATPDMMRVIAVHELIHACGLEDGDHADDGLFYFPLAASGNGKLIVPETGKDKRRMPPLFLAASTVSKISTLW